MKRYIAILNQIGQNAPVVTILENSLGPIVWTRGGIGIYIGTLAGAFPAAATTALCGDGTGGELGTLTAISLGQNSNDFVAVTTKEFTAEGELVDRDNLLVKTTIEIRVYE